MPKFLAVIKAWIVGHKLISIAIGVGAAAVIATSVAVPVAVTNHKFNVTWKNEDGTVLVTSQVKRGEMPEYAGETPTKAETAQYSYTFAGWEPEIVEASADVAYTAKFTSTVKSYNVKFMDEDGSKELKSETLQYGATPVAPADPVKDDTAEWDYSFSGWDNQIAPVTGNQTYTATYSKEKQKYSVRFLDEDGITELKNESLEYGATPVAPADPVKDDTAEWDYTFTGWDKPISVVQGAQTYKATYSQVKQKYSVRFLDEDETELKSESLEYGATPIAPSNPEKSDTAEWDYTFTGWDHPIAEVHGAQTYHATYSSAKQEYLVRFLDEDETELQSGYVKYGETPVAPTDPVKGDTAEWDYSFNGWDHAISEVHSAQTYTATYSATKQKYDITWKDSEGNVIKTDQVAYGALPSYSGDTPEKAEDDGYTYAFNAWSPTPVAVTGAAEYTATFTPTIKKYTVLFKDYDGTTLGSKEMSYDDLMSSLLNPVTEEPSRADEGSISYQFIGWDRAYTNVRPDTLVYTAAYLQYYHATDKYYVEALTTSFFDGTVTIPDTYRGEPVTQIYADAFKNRRLGGISIGSNINYIGISAFEGVDLESITIPGSIGVIDENAFLNTPKLKTVTFNEGLTQVRAHAFDGSGFRYLTLPASVSNVSTMAFANNHALIKATLNATDFSGYDSPYYGTNIFGNCGSLTELICPNAETAYDNGYSDQTLARLNSSTKGNTGTFGFIDPDKDTNEVGKITYVKKGETKVYLVSVFDDVGLAKKVLHTDGIDQIKKLALKMTDIEEVYISQDTTAIGKEAFEYCESLEVLEFEEGDTNLSTNSSMFRGCINLESVDMSARRIDDLVTYGFEGCTKLSNIIMSPYSTHIGGFALTNTAIEELFIPKDVNGIDSDAFRTTHSLKKFVVDPDSTYYKDVDDCLYTKNGKRLMAFPSAKIVEDNTFTVPEGVEELMGRVFQEATLEVINLPSTLKSLWNFSFYRSNATTVNYPGTKAEFEALTIEDGWARDASFSCVNCLGDSSTSTKGF